MSQRWLVALFCGCVLYLTLYYQLGNLAFLGPDEPRYARISEEMNLRESYVTPTLDFRPWLEKPPLLFWLEAASFKLFGVDEWSARLPIATLAMVTILAVSAFMLNLRGIQSAIVTLLVLSTSGMFFSFGRAASTDMPLVAMLTLAMLSGFKSSCDGSKWWATLTGISLGLAILAKGPVALVLFVGIFLMYFLLTQAQVWTRSQILVMNLLCLTVAAPWFWRVWQENGYYFITSFWINHHLARFVTDIHHHSQPLWYYPIVVMVGFFPWTPFLGSALARLWHHRSSLFNQGGNLELFLWLWIAVPLLFFSLGESKLPGYILPVIPPLSIVVAAEWCRWFNGDAIVHRSMRNQLIALTTIGLVVGSALIWIFSFDYQAPGIGILLSLPIVGAIVCACLEYRRRRPLRIFLSLVAGMSLFAAFIFWKASPVVNDYHSARNICHLISPKLSHGKPLIFYRYFHHTARYYTSYQTTQESIETPVALQSYLLEHPQDRYYLITQEAGWNDLKSSFKSSLLHRQGPLYLAEILR